MYPLILTIHSWARWIVLVLAVATVGQAVRGWMGRKAWTSQDRRLGMLFTISLDVQVLLGLILYFLLSPTTTPVLSDPGRMMSEVLLRYWTTEHGVPMIAALVLAHLGQILTKGSEGTTQKHRRAALLFGLAALVIFLAIPWPFYPHGRPLLRLG